jgi:hypothetical protein
MVCFSCQRKQQAAEVRAGLAEKNGKNSKKLLKNSYARLNILQYSPFSCYNSLMTIPSSIVKKAWERSGGRCECTRTNHWHKKRCNRIVVESFRGERDNFYGWEIHNKNGQHPSLSDCEILCVNCYSVIKKL